MENKIIRNKWISVVLLWFCIPMVIPFLAHLGYIIYRTNLVVPDYQKDILLFVEYDAISDQGSGILEAKGIVKSNNAKSCPTIGYYDTFSDAYFEKGLGLLKSGDLLPIWYSPKYDISEYRFKNNEKKDLQYKEWKHSLVYYYIPYFVLIIITIIMYRKYKKYKLEDLLGEHNKNNDLEE